MSVFFTPFHIHGSFMLYSDRSVRVTVSLCFPSKFLCGDNYFGFALIPYHIRVHAVVTVVALTHISIFC